MPSLAVGPHSQNPRNSSSSLPTVLLDIVKQKASLNNGCKRPGWTKHFFKGSLEFKSKHVNRPIQGPITILVQNRSASLASHVHHRQLRHRLVELYETHGSDSASAADNYFAEVPQNGAAWGGPLRLVIRLLIGRPTNL